MIRSILLCLGLVLAGPALADGQTKTTAAPLARVSLALDWTLNTNHIGLVVADAMGFYAQEGLELELLPYSDTNSAALLAAGAADYAYLTSLGFMQARASGAEITALWATMQHEAGRLVYAADNPAITRPADLTGKTYAGFGSAWEAALIAAMIRADGGVPEWDTVTLGTGAYEALASGAVDFTLEVATWEGVNSALLGRKQASFRYADYGIPDQQTGYIGSQSARLTAQPAQVASFMRATAKGYAWAAEHPQQAADLLLAAGDFPNAALVQGSMQALVQGGYFGSSDQPIGQIDLPRFAAMAEFLFQSGVLKDGAGAVLDWPGDVSDWVDQSWRQNPKGLPVLP